MKELREQVIKNIKEKNDEHRRLQNQIDNFRGYDPEEYEGREELLEQLHDKQNKVYKEKVELEKKLHRIDGEDDRNLLEDLFGNKE